MQVKPSDNLPAYLAARFKDGPTFAYIAATMPIDDVLKRTAFNAALYGQLEGSKGGTSRPSLSEEFLYRLRVGGWYATEGFRRLSEGVRSIAKDLQPELATEGAGGATGGNVSATTIHPRPERPTSHEGDAFIDRETSNDAAIRAAADIVEPDVEAQRVANAAAEIVLRKIGEKGGVTFNLNNIQGDAHIGDTVNAVSAEVKQIPGFGKLAAAVRESIATIASALAIWGALSSPTQPEQIHPDRDYPTATVTAQSGLNLRPTASQDYPAMLTLPHGASVKVISDGPNWSFVQARDPATGTVLTGHVCGLWLSDATGGEDCD